MKEIYKRRSIRNYNDKEISKESINEIIKCGMNAPTAMNQMPFEFVVLNDKNLLKRITTFHPYSKMLENANKAIIVCVNTEFLKDKAKEYFQQDCAAVTQNILLGATSLNIGSVWLGVYPNVDLINNLRTLINADDNIIPFSIISLGYSDDLKEANNKFFEDRIHINKY